MNDTTNHFRRRVSAPGHCGAENAPGVGYDRFKRAIDIAAALTGITLCLPVLLACGAWVWFTDGGPVLYYQWRVGRDGWLFRLYKLRTMTCDAEHDGQALFATSGDPRVLCGCRWMRRSHVDELPQLWNILVGQMSLVGPRPERPEMFERLKRAIPKLERRLVGKPGLTGLAQIRNGYTNDIAGARKKLAYDLRYLRSRSLLTELRLVFATIPRIWDQSAI